MALALLQLCLLLQCLLLSLPPPPPNPSDLTPTHLFQESHCSLQLTQVSLLRASTLIRRENSNDGASHCIVLSSSQNVWWHVIYFVLKWIPMTSCEVGGGRFHY